MTTPHRATPDQWHNIDQYRKLDRAPDHISITLELADRLATAEQQNELSLEALRERLSVIDRALCTHDVFSRIALAEHRLATAEQRISELENAAEPQITPEEAEMIAAPWSLITPEPKPAAHAGSLVEVVVEEICHITGNHVDDDVARGVILAVAEWLEENQGPMVAHWLRQEVKRHG